jgi:hypothetical protein
MPYLTSDKHSGVKSQVGAFVELFSSRFFQVANGLIFITCYVDSRTWARAAFSLGFRCLRLFQLSLILYGHG